MPRRHVSIRRSLIAIARAFADIETALRRIEKRVRARGRTSRRQLKLSPKRRAQLKLQGAYMGYMRQLKPAQKARVKAAKLNRGFEAAIRMARKMAGRGATGRRAG